MSSKPEYYEGATPLLTIAIPTYNRARFLNKLLEELLDQLRECPSVELIVSDNASSDNTSEVVRTYSERGLRIKYIRNEANVGMDRNFLQCFQMAQGKYFWLLGDDDLVLPGGVQLLLAELISNDFDLVYFSPFTHPEYSRRGKEVAADGIRSVVVHNRMEFAHRVNLSGDLIYISSLVINKERIQSCFIDFESLVGTYILQMGWVLTALKQFQRGLIFSLGILLGGADDFTGGFDAAQIFGENYRNVIFGILGDEDDLAHLLLDDLLVIWFPRHWLNFRRGVKRIAADNPHKRLKSIFGSNSNYWLFAYPLFILPIPLDHAYNICSTAVSRATDLMRRKS